MSDILVWRRHDKYVNWIDIEIGGHTYRSLAKFDDFEEAEKRREDVQKELNEKKVSES